jgi:hypothetical protein
MRDYLPGIILQSRLRRGTIHLLTAFTGDEEQGHAIDVMNFVPPSDEVLRDYQPVVIVIEADWMRKESEHAPVRRLIARVRNALTRRPGKTPKVR